MHACPALNGMAVPFVQVTDPTEQTTARHVVVEAEDYIGDRSSPITAIRTERPDGSTDVNVYPDAAVATVTT